VTGRTIELWSAALRAKPDSTMTIKSPGVADDQVRARLVKQFGVYGIDPSRLYFLSRDANERDHLRRYGEIDVALDSYPYNGTTTTCEALWMGVPVVTLEGPTRVARTTGGILRAIGLAGLCAADAPSFANIATDAARRIDLRATLRERMRASPLMDGTSLAREIERALVACAKERARS
jgi:protein O-GlcNAc transferase